MKLRSKQGVIAPLFLVLSIVSAQNADVTVTVQNVDSSAWVVKSVKNAEGVAELNTQNTPITLTIGQRYRFVNLGTLQIHPFAIRGENGDSLLNQRPQDRPFETDPGVKFVADDEGITFTLTPTLAAQVGSYYCTAHPAPLMEAPLKVRKP